MFFNKIFLLLVLGIFTVSVSSESVAKSTNRSTANSTSTKRPLPPKRIPPNKVKPGGGLDASHQSCEVDDSSLTALIPIDNPVLTTQSNPSFLFYIPDEAAAISHGEFSLFTAEEKTRIYSTKIDLKNTPGIVKIDLPSSPQYALKTEQPYHWYFKVYCQNESDSPQVLDVDGWIERVHLTSSRVSQIEAASTDIWYDAIAITAQNLIATPDDPEVRDRWIRLLEFIDRSHLGDLQIQSITTTTVDLSQDSQSSVNSEQ